MSHDLLALAPLRAPGGTHTCAEQTSKEFKCLRAQEMDSKDLMRTYTVKVTPGDFADGGEGKRELSVVTEQFGGRRQQMWRKFCLFSSSVKWGHLCPTS